MPAKWHKYSYSAQREERMTFLSIVVLVFSLYIVFAMINQYLLTMYFIESSTMEPTISSGDCLITTPLYDSVPNNTARFSLLIKPERGDLVIISPTYSNNSNVFLKTVNALVSFLTFQRIRPFDQKEAWGEKPVIRRIAAFPGDSVYMDNFVLHIKTSDSAHFLSEFEISENNYEIKLDRLPAAWSAELPFSGTVTEITLKDNEYFVLCDNRKNSSDSRIWGPVSTDRIQGKVLFRYWPFGTFGTP